MLLMSERERERLRLIELIADGRMRQRDTALRLEISVRQVKRLLRAGAYLERQAWHLPQA